MGDVGHWPACRCSLLLSAAQRDCILSSVLPGWALRIACAYSLPSCSSQTPVQVLSQAASGAMQLAPGHLAQQSAPGSSAPAAAAGSASQPSASVLTVNNFLLQTGLDNLNLFKLVRCS